MIDATTPTSETTTPPKKKRHISPPGMNQGLLREVMKTELICAVFSKTLYKAKLIAREISAAFVTQLKADAAATRKLFADATQSGNNRQVATASGVTAERKLLAGLQEVQAAARQKYLSTTPVKMKDYFIGVGLNGNRSNLLQTSAAIIERLDDDSLPGITADKIEALTTLRDAWVEATGEQSDDGSETKTEITSRDEMVQSIIERRRQIQCAADAEWPYTNRDNEAARREFQLPLTRPFVVPQAKAATPA